MRTTHLRRIGLVAVIAAATAGSGCASMNNTEKGAAVGGGFGAVAGTAIGAATGRPLLGAAIGGATGTAVGALAGNEADKDEARKREAIQQAQLAQAQAAQYRLGITDVITMVKGGHSDTVIINQIRTTHSTFQLSAADLDLLKTNGVSDRVIAEMQAAQPVPGRVLVQQPVVYEQPVGGVYVQPSPVVVVRPWGGYGYYRRW
jgi:hypothetical protein